MIARCLMVQGTGSGVGKSLMTAALIRVFARRGLRVAPFKAQNMALNAAVTADGGEIGRSQAAQADAAGIEATVDMNPILLKPEGDDRSQVVVHGRPVGTMRFAEYRQCRPRMLEAVTASLHRLRQQFDLILMEGAGSPAEINLDPDLVNMPIARLSGARVLLVGDIDRGGVFASLFGTLALLEPCDRALVGGFLINRFRGDRAVLDPGIVTLERLTGVPVLGVVPMLDTRGVPAEDSQDLDSRDGEGDARVVVAVVRLPRIANFDDVEPLAREPGVHVAFTRSPARIRDADLVVLPGSKSTIADLAWLGASGVADAVGRAASDGTPVLGICGGFQMLGRVVRDPERVESDGLEAAGLGLLPVETTFVGTKTTARVRATVAAERGVLAEARGVGVAGYEIHMGRTAVADAAPAFTVRERAGMPVHEAEGAVSADGVVSGTYLHGVLASAPLRRALLEHLARSRGIAPHPAWGSAHGATDPYDRLADAVEAAVDVAAVAKLAGL